MPARMFAENAVTGNQETRMSIDPEVVSILACPKCRGGLSLVEKDGMAAGLACNACRLIYRIEDDIPVLLIEEAAPLTVSQ